MSKDQRALDRSPGCSQLQIQLNEAECFFRDVLDAHHDHVTVLDETGKITFGNRAWHEFWDKNGGAPAADRYTNYLEVCDRATGDCHEGAQAAALAIRKVLAKESSYETFTYTCHSPHVNRWFRCVITPLPSSRPGALVTHQNVTELVSSQIAEANAHRDLENVLDAASQVSIIAADTKGVVTLFNNGAERMLGYSAEEMVGRQTPAVFHLEAEIEQHGEELSEQFGKPIKGFDVFVEMARQGSHEEREWTYVHKDGTQFPVNLIVTANRDHDNNIVGYLGIAIDITAKKRAEERNATLAERLSLALRSSHTGLWDWKVEYDGIHFSDTWYTMLGYEPSELPMSLSTWIDLCHPDERNEVANAFDAIRDGRRRVFEGEYRILHKDGHWLWIRSVGEVVEQRSDGSPLRIIGTNVDIQTLHESIESAQAASRAKGQFLANMSHEIRTPMTAILGYVDLLLCEEGLEDAPSERVNSFRTIKRNGEHLLRIINDILDLSKIDDGNLKIERIEFSPHQVLSEVMRLMEPRASDKGLNLMATVENQIPIAVSSDPTRLRQILLNLLGNAIKFTDAGSVRVAVRAIKESNSNLLAFDVTDTGIGMTAEQAERVFLPFQQADNSMARRYGGTGLGLSISKHLAKLLGGDVTVTSVQGKGSTFTLTIDSGIVLGEAVSSQAGVELRRVNHSIENNASSETGIRKLEGARILLVEDCPDNQRLISFLLRKAGAELTVAENGQVGRDIALESLKEGSPFDVILTDMQMPVMDGYTAARELRAAGYSGPIVALTAHAMDGERQKCLEAGCDDFATKPIDREQLITQIAGWLPDRTNLPDFQDA